MIGRHFFLKNIVKLNRFPHNNSSKYTNKLQQLKFENILIVILSTELLKKTIN